ncbi:MAG: phenylalanine--tRNA ligase subunit alpha [Acidobacteria bacterium]|nr:phenylalanine--tRNA ligase subunit alpha [Acidobacteriota bacterium]MCA1643314.1 phenylalanine--tRNA ligase subunit alpha [Acidobacteriota bacterium]
MLDDLKTALKDVEAARTLGTGKKSKLSTLMKSIGRVPLDERAEFGQRAIALNNQIIEDYQLAQAHLKLEIGYRTLELERLDVTLPGRRPRRGHLHPITLVRQRLEDIFVSMGYAVEDGPEIETDFYNFTALNIPPDHPARSVQDTFYTSDGYALRSQTSTVQVHAMQRRRPPLRVVAPGRVFRRDTPDATHNPMFFQIEGLVVDRGITMAHLKGTVTEFLRRTFGAGTRTRFRPSYFPFTEPSAEFDFTCFKCGGRGCALCKGSGWIELGGSGMVHPNVLRAVGIDPEEFSGFAFGFGIDRMCGLMYSLDDIRLLFENDVRFLEQFN